MKRRHHTPEQIIRKLREAERVLAEGSEVPEALEVSEQTFHPWRAQYGGMRVAEMRGCASSRQRTPASSGSSPTGSSRPMDRPRSRGDLRAPSPGAVSPFARGCTRFGRASSTLALL